MAKARRAKARPSRIVVPIIVVAAAVAAVVAWQVVPRSSDAVAGGSRSVAVAPGTSASSSPSPTPGPSTGVDNQAAAHLSSCRDRVGEADAVLAAAKTGIGHWAEHVQAQTDANVGRITVVAMDATFTRTRLAGPEDQDRYRKAVTSYEDADGSCSAVAGASTKESAALSSCRDRSRAQQPVLKAAGDAMADWRSHLAAMARSRAHHMDDAEQIWIDAWEAAPPHIQAYDKAAAALRDAPDC